MGVIPYAMSNVSEVVIGAINSSATLSVGGGGASVFAGIVVSAKGEPFTLLHVNKSKLNNVLGKPLHPSKGKCAEPIRHVAEAAEYGEGYVVRVVSEDARYPYLTIAKGKAPAPSEGDQAKAKANEKDKASDSKAPVVLAAEAGKVSDVVTKGNSPFGTPVTLPDDSALALYVVDGDPSLNRSISMTQADPERYSAGMFHLTVTEQDSLGFDNELESLLVSMNPEATDDMGAPAYIETVLENSSKCLRAIVGEGADQLAGFDKVALEGGTNGDQNKISAEQYQKAVTILRDAMVGYTAILGLGCYDSTVLAALAGVCNDRRIDGFMDAPCYLNYAGADKWVNDLNLNNHRICMYHFPYTAKDASSGARMAWGLSGVAFGAKAQGVRTVPDVGGWHISPAGETRGVIPRRAIKPNVGLDSPDYERMYRTRINKVAIGSGGAMVIDDAITTWKKEDYLRFQHVSSLFDAFSRAFYDLARTLKHEPDGLTLESLNRELPKLADKFVACGALVKPRDPADGDMPYKIDVTMPEGGAIDLWKITWSLCPTGSARRLFGQPVILR